MAKNKTTETKASVEGFLNKIPNEVRRKDGFDLLEIMKSQIKTEPKMWGPTIVGFGSYHYKYETGHEGDAPLTGFSPRSSSLSVYLSPEFEKKDELLEKLGKHKMAKSCLYINKLADVDVKVLKQIIKASVAAVRTKYPDNSL